MNPSVLRAHTKLDLIPHVVNGKPKGYTRSSLTEPDPPEHDT